MEDCWNRVARRQCDDLHPTIVEKRTRIDDYRVDPSLNDLRKAASISRGVAAGRIST